MPVTVKTSLDKQRRLHASMSQLVPHLELPNELLFKILAHVLGLVSVPQLSILPPDFYVAHSVHMVIISPHDIEWDLNAHHILSSVCFSFQEIMKGISSKAFQFSVSETTPK